ncbi:hypothetical protein CR513_21300, partial [Mucuna pruriens]
MKIKRKKNKKNREKKRRPRGFKEKKQRKTKRRSTLSKKRTLIPFSYYICFHVSSSLFVLPTWFRKMLENFKDLFPKDIPRGLPPIKGIKYHIDFTLGATLPNKASYKSNLEESKEIQQVGKLVEKG